MVWIIERTLEIPNLSFRESLERMVVGREYLKTEGYENYANILSSPYTSRNQYSKVNLVHPIISPGGDELVITPQEFNRCLEIDKLLSGLLKEEFRPKTYNPFRRKVLRTRMRVKGVSSVTSVNFDVGKYVLNDNFSLYIGYYFYWFDRRNPINEISDQEALAAEEFWDKFRQVMLTGGYTPNPTSARDQTTNTSQDPKTPTVNPWDMEFPALETILLRGKDE